MSAVALGLDMGSTTAKLVGVDAAGALVRSRIEPTDPRMEAQAARLIAEAGGEGLPLVATGYGRKLVSQATRRVTEITCHAKGVYRKVGHGGTLIDVGGQDSKVIVIGDDGKVISFAMNDKCAAGTGRFLEVTAGRLRMDLDVLSTTCLAAPREVAISSTCTVFAESELIGLLARGEELEPIVRGLVRSLVQRVASLARSAHLRPPVLMSGGVARGEGVRALLSEELGLPVTLPEHPQLMGAYGAALIAAGL